jgi:DNA-binding helix-hairpin-helix protein with protein kinase domain
MEHAAEIDILQKNTVYQLSNILQELRTLRDLTNDEDLQRDYEIYIRDIQRFLKKSSQKTMPLEEIQVYIDDYQEVIERAKAEEME